MSAPTTVAEPGLPAQVTIHEVGPRDGLQNETTVVSTDVKAALVARLADAGLPRVEATSFVSPRWVPQLADAAELMATLEPRPGVRYPVLVPNEKGLDRALAAGANDLAIFAAATDAFARANLGRGLDEQWAMFAPVADRARHAGVRLRGYLSMCFGDPWEGEVAIDQVVAAVQQLIALGCDEISLGDTIGVATPGHVRALLSAVAADATSLDAVAVHFHDTYGQALANTYAALHAGVTVVDAAAGGLGGCPYARSATGNLATEDLVWLLDGLGITHGVDLHALVSTSTWMAGHLDRPSPSRVVHALASADR